MIVLWVILALLVAFLCVIFIRAALFKPVRAEECPAEEVTFNREKAVCSLGELVRCRTVSYRDSALEDGAEFGKLIGMLPALYPNVYRACSFDRLPDRALLFRWPGKNHDAPSVMMAHFDVVPVEESEWTKPPFDALIENGVMWGRGTLDTKVTFNGILSAADALIAQRFVPENDIYFAFSGGEEIWGPGAANIVAYFKKHGIVPALVADEGGAVTEKVFPGVKEPCGFIGIAEKGILNLEYSIASEGGHASAPAAHTPVGILSRACCRVESHPFPAHLTKPAAEMLDTLGRRSTFGMKLVLANLWCFGGLFQAVCKKSELLNALMRTTVAFTMMSGSKVANVIPPSASMVSNIRLNPEDTVASATEYLRRTIGDGRVKITNLGGMDPSPISETNCPAWQKVANAVSGTWKGTVVSPYLMVQCSDSRHYAGLSDHVYRFSAMDLTDEERKTIHGNDEHIRLETVERAVEFYIRLMKQC